MSYDWMLRQDRKYMNENKVYLTWVIDLIVLVLSSTGKNRSHEMTLLVRTEAI